jgi:predicted Zn-dependent peptidase
MNRPVQRYNVITNNSDVFHIVVYVNAGSIYEVDGKRGISHMLEHMMFKGATSTNANIIPRDLTYVGGMWNGITTPDATYYYIMTHHNNYKQALQIMHKILNNPLIDSKQLKVERNVVIEEIKGSRDSFDWKFEKLCYASIYNKNNPYLADVGGTPKEIASFTRKDLRDYYNEYYKDMVATINCKASIRDEVQRMCQTMFGKQTHVDMNNTAMFGIVQQIERKVLILARPSAQFTTRLNFPAFPESDVKNNIALKLLSYTLTGSGLISLLNYDLRVKRGLVYGVHSGNDAYRYMGMYFINIMSSNKDTLGILEIVLRLLSQVKKEGLDKDLFKYYKSSFINTMHLRFSSPSYVSHWTASNMFYGVNLTVKEYMKMIEDLTNDDLIATARILFDFDRVGVVSVGGYSSPKRITKQVHELLFHLSRRS